MASKTNDVEIDCDTHDAIHRKIYLGDVYESWVLDRSIFGDNNAAFASHLLEIHDQHCQSCYSYTTQQKKPRKVKALVVSQRHSSDLFSEDEQSIVDADVSPQNSPDGKRLRKLDGTFTGVQRQKTPKVITVPMVITQEPATPSRQSRRLSLKPRKQYSLKTEDTGDTSKETSKKVNTSDALGKGTSEDKNDRNNKDTDDKGKSKHEKGRVSQENAKSEEARSLDDGYTPRKVRSARKLEHIAEKENLVDGDEEHIASKVKGKTVRGKNKLLNEEFGNAKRRGKDTQEHEECKESPVKAGDMTESEGLHDDANTSDHEDHEDGSERETDRGQYRCRTCGKTFGRHAHLKRHVNIHTHAVVYDCESCGIIFTDSSNLLKHKRNCGDVPQMIMDKEKADISEISNEQIDESTDEKMGEAGVADDKADDGTNKEVLDSNKMRRNDVEIETNSKEKPVAVKVNMFTVTSKQVESRKDNQNKVTDMKDNSKITKRIDAGEDESSVELKKDNQNTNSENGEVNEDEGNEDAIMIELMFEEFSKQGDDSEHDDIAVDDETENTSVDTGTSIDKEQMESTGMTKFKCKKCKKIFSSQYFLTKHEDTHTDGEYKCTVCEEGFNKKRLFKQHLKKHRDKKYKCEACGRCFYQEKSIETHKCSANPKEKYICSICGKTFRQEHSLEEHNNMHSGVKPYTCDHCGKGFISKSNLQKHAFVHTGQRPHTCDTCGKSYSLQSHLSRHKKLHLGDKPYKCETCGKGFADSSNAKAHQLIHTGVKGFTCEVCGKSFPRNNTLMQHKRIHSDIKLYKCEVCNRDFTFSTNLAKHRRLHTGVRPYQCEFCQRKFSDSSHLSRHRRTHTGVRPYKCRECGKTFTMAHHVRSHLRTHNVDPGLAKTVLEAIEKTKNPTYINAGNVEFLVNDPPEIESENVKYIVRNEADMKNVNYVVKEGTSDNMKYMYMVRDGEHSEKVKYMVKGENIQDDIEYVELDENMAENVKYVQIEKPKSDNVKYVQIEQPKSDNVKYVQIDQPKSDNVKYVQIEKPDSGVEYVEIDQRNTENVKYVEVDPGHNENVKYMEMAKGGANNVEYIVKNTSYAGTNVKYVVSEKATAANVHAEATNEEGKGQMDEATDYAKMVMDTGEENVEYVLSEEVGAGGENVKYTYVDEGSQTNVEYLKVDEADGENIQYVVSEDNGGGEEGDVKYIVVLK